VKQLTVFGREDGLVGDAFLRVRHDVVDVLWCCTLAFLTPVIDPLILPINTHTQTRHITHVPATVLLITLTNTHAAIDHLTLPWPVNFRAPPSLI